MRDTLSIMLANYGHVAPFKQPEGVELNGLRLMPVEVTPIVAAYRRMVRNTEFDICELAPVTYITAREAGVPIIALPIFVNRSFHHNDIACRPGSGITTPKDLEHRRVGVRAYSVSTGVWVRGILADEYGVDLQKVTWVVDDEEHVQNLSLPGNVVHVSKDTSLSEMFRNGGLDAAVKGAAGIGRTGAAAKNWENGAVQSTEFYDLLENASELDALSYHTNHIYPIHGIVVIREEVVKRYPWLPQALYDSMLEAKNAYLSKLERIGAQNANDEKFLHYKEIIQGDPLPYGIEKNEATLNALVRYAYEQELTRRKYTLEELFVPIKEQSL